MRAEIAEPPLQHIVRESIQKGYANTVDLFTLVTHTTLPCETQVRVRNLDGLETQHGRCPKRLPYCEGWISGCACLSDTPRTTHSVDVSEIVGVTLDAGRVRVRFGVVGTRSMR